MAEGEAGLVDRSSRLRRCPGRTPASVEERIWRLRRSTRRAPVHLSARTPVPASTVWRILQHFASNAFAEALAERSIVHRRTRRYRPQTNGKAERFNRTLTEAFLYAKRFRFETERRIRLRRRIHDYNCHRHHTAVGGPPASRANNLTRTDS